MDPNSHFDDLTKALVPFRSLLLLLQSEREALFASLRAVGKVLTCGNRSSAATAAHLSEELVGCYKDNRHSLHVI